MTYDNLILRNDWFWKADKPFPETFLSGACLLIRNDKLFFHDQKIFDEQFFFFYEDDDLCYRAYLRNKIVVVVPKAEVVHYWNQSPSADKNKFLAESRKKFTLKF